MLDYGRKIADGHAGADSERRGRGRAYLGGAHGDANDRRTGMSALLDVKQLEVAYGGIKAIKKIDFHVAEGELVT